MSTIQFCRLASIRHQQDIDLTMQAPWRRECNFAQFLIHLDHYEYKVARSALRAGTRKAWTLPGSWLDLMKAEQDIRISQLVHKNRPFEERSRKSNIRTMASKETLTVSQINQNSTVNSQITSNHRRITIVHQDQSCLPTSFQSFVSQMHAKLNSGSF